MIVDSHCHAWREWPYEPPVPDKFSRSTIEQLIFNMDANDVERAIVVSANIGSNTDNNEYVYECVGKFPTRLIQLADVDSCWSDSYHKAGSAQRLQQMIDRYCLQGFTHYIAVHDNSDWLFGDEGLDFFSVAAANNQFVSLSAPITLIPAITKIAALFSGIPFILHHMGLEHTPTSQEGSLHDIAQNLDVVIAASRQPNIHIKTSGFHHIWNRSWDFPYSELRFVSRMLYESFGPHRLHWGSDSPVSSRHLTYRQSLETFRHHFDFISENDLQLILGNSLNVVIANCGVSES